MFRLCLFLFFPLATLIGCGSGGENSTSDSIDYSKIGPDGPNAQSEFTETDSGLKYRILREGNETKPTASNRVSVSYEGTLMDGSIFDSSYGRGEPAEFPLQAVIPGWMEGMQLVGEGGKIELLIPAELGYGQRGAPPRIPANATLKFIVELHEVN